MARRVAITRKVSLAEFADGWDDCFAIVTLADFSEMQEIAAKDFKSLTDIEAVGFEIEVVMKHFVSGKINVINDAGQAELVDMVAADVQAGPKIADRLYAVIMGVTLDPKGTETAVTNSPTPTPDSNSTKTTSSTT